MAFTTPGRRKHIKNLLYPGQNMRVSIPEWIFSRQARSCAFTFNSFIELALCLKGAFDKSSVVRDEELNSQIPIKKKKSTHTHSPTNKSPVYRLSSRPYTTRSMCNYDVLCARPTIRHQRSGKGVQVLWWLLFCVVRLRLS